ncbi:NADH dehydrogenase [ubiquinone] 1 beta subcomplex subunit 9 [Glycine soja]|nr:NADH dehydrogenase [ubiquinone] 1 beta subcomplex subunit 9 [Glycine soja]
MASTAAYLARRAAQKERVRIRASNLRERFEENRHVEDPDTIDRLIADAEASYNKWRHPDPYIVPWAPGGSKFTRNPTPPQGIEIVYNYGREDND